MLYLEFENNSFFRSLTYRGDFLGLSLFWTSSVDCACIGSPMTKCFMFLECSLRDLQCGAFNCSVRWHINLVECFELKGSFFCLTFLGLWT
jgi:hypothetical protein